MDGRRRERRRLPHRTFRHWNQLAIARERQRERDELLHFLNLPPGGHALIASNQFGTPGIPATSGYNDIIDFTGGNRPGPILEVIGNTFLSAVDDVFDMDGTDAHIEGNIFINVLQDAQRDSGSYPITTGANGSDRSQLVVCRNIFYNCEHTLLIKEHGTMLVQNNTGLRLTTNTTARTAGGAQIPPGIINFGEPWRGVSGGDGAIFEANIVWDLEAPPFNYFTNGTMFLTVAHSLIQATNFPGTGNLSNNPLFVSTTNLTYLNIRSNLALLPGSPCLGTGPNGLDMGALVPGGASISGEPASPTTNTSATLTVARSLSPSRRKPARLTRCFIAIPSTPRIPGRNSPVPTCQHGAPMRSRP